MANELKILITGDASSAMGVLDQFSKQVRDSTGGIESQFRGLNKIVANFAAPFAALMAVVGGGAFLKGTINETRDWTVEAQKLARTLGVTTEEASVFGVAIREVHGDADMFLSIATKMTRTLNSNESAFQKLGVATRDHEGHLRNTKDIMLDTFAALSTMKEGTDRNIASTQIFGKGWLEVQKYLAITRDTMVEAKEKAEKLNLIVGSDSVAATKAYRKSAEDLDLTIKALKIRIGQELMPVMQDFNSMAAEEGPAALGVLGAALKSVSELVDGVWSGLKMFALGIGSIFRSLLNYVSLLLTTTWGFLKAGIPGAKKAFTEYNEGMKAEWSDTWKMIDEIGMKYTERQEARWGGGPAGSKGKAGAAAGGHADTKEHAEKTDPYAEEMLRLRKQGLEFAVKTTLEDQRLAEVHKLDLQRAEDLRKIQADLDKKDSTLTPGEAAKLRLQVEENYANGRMEVWDKFAVKRKEMEAHLQELLTSEEEGGLAKRLAAIKKTMDEARKLNAELLQAGKNPIATEEQLQAAQLAAEARARKEQAKQDLEELKKDLAQQAQIKGPMSGSDLDNALGAYAAKGASQGAAVKTYRLEMHLDESASAGALDGLKRFAGQTDSIFKQMETFATNMANTMSNSLGKAFTDILTKGMGFGAAMKELWKGMTQAVIGALMQMAARQIVNWGIEKAISAWKVANTTSMAAMRETALAQGGVADAQATASTVAASETQAAAGETAMAAKIYAWYSSMGPWAIPAAAATIAGVIAAIGQIGKITAHATGGIISTPTLALMGEAGPEIVAPQHDFNNWASANQNLGYNLASHAAQVSRLQGQAGSYGAQALQSGGGQGGTIVHVNSPIIAGESVESSRIFGNLVKKHLDAYNRRNG